MEQFDYQPHAITPISWLTSEVSHQLKSLWEFSSSHNMRHLRLPSFHRRRKKMGNCVPCINPEECQKTSAFESTPQEESETDHGREDLAAADSAPKSLTLHDDLSGETSTPELATHRQQDQTRTLDDQPPSRRKDRRMQLRRRSRTQRHHFHLLRGLKRGTFKIASKVSHTVGHVFTSIDEFMFPPSQLVTDFAPKVRGGVLLYGCTTAEEHKAKSAAICGKTKDLHGQEGLAVAGFEYRLVLCDIHRRHESPEDDDDDVQDYRGLDIMNGADMFNEARPHSDATLSVPELTATDRSVWTERSTAPPERLTLDDMPCRERMDCDIDSCPECKTRLFHIETNTLIRESNMKRFIADGDMYEAVSRLAQEYAHERLVDQGGLRWVTLSDDVESHQEPIRALVRTYDDQGSDPRPTLLIATGKGKVRAGIFSRYHLMVSGVEQSCALPIVREAAKRQMNIAVIDPNVHGDRLGMYTFEKSMAELFRDWETRDSTDSTETPLRTGDLYILSHSASGAQLARYLLDKSTHYLPHIRAIAFTDSTHNIQWARESNQELCELLESSACVYFKCASESREGSQWYLHRAGEQVNTDAYWEHRFGKIRTLWAGTNEHSLTNWFAHHKIWEHFDSHLSLNDPDVEAQDLDETTERVKHRKPRHNVPRGPITV